MVQQITAVKTNSTNKNINMKSSCGKYVDQDVLMDMNNSDVINDTGTNGPSDIVLYKLPDANINIGKVCRTCFSSTDVKYIFDITLDDISISTLLFEHACINVKENDILSKYICDTCLVELVHCHQFKKKCLLTEDTLQEIIRYSKVKRNNFSDEPILQIPFILHNFAHIKNDGVIKANKVLNCTKERFKTESFQDMKKTINELNTSKSTEDEIEIKGEYLEVKSNFSLEQVCNNLPQSIVEIDEQNEKVEGIGKSEKPDTEISRTCYRCSKIFQCRKEYYKHFHVKHALSRRSVCHVCGKLCRRYHIQLHMRTHTKEKPFQCKTCLKAFSLKYNLQRHIIVHTGEKPHVCDICHKGFTRAASLIIHKRSHTREKPHSCDGCGRGFKQLKRLIEHNCSFGDVKRFTQLPQIKRQRINKQKSQCRLCLKYFATTTTLKTHLRTHGEKSFLCNYCGRGFHTNAGLHTHLNVHTGERPFPCTKCDKSFAQAGGLQKHLLVHSGERPYSCEVCSRTFVQKTHLKRHVMQHTGEKPYKCLYCSKRFAMNGNLKVHVRTHTGEAPYVCDLCGQGFYDSSSMKKHKRRHKVD